MYLRNVLRKLAWVFPLGVVAFVAILCISLVGCSGNSDIANGTGSNAGETEIAGIITATNHGKPLVNALARVWILDEDSMHVAYEDSLDNNGVLEIRSTVLGEKAPVQLLETRSGDSLSTMRWVNLERSPEQTLSIAASETLKGSITNNGVAVEGATVSILDKSVVTDVNGNFEFNDLPAGVHYAFVEGYFGKFSYQMETGLNEGATTNNINLADRIFTVVEDFENWKKQTFIGKSFGQGWWFICTDSLQGGGSRASAGVDSENLFVSGDSAKSGKSLHVSFDIDEKTPGHYGVIGFTIGDDFDKAEMFAFYDLRKATAISFDARGSGKISLQIAKRSDKGEREYHESYFVTLTEKWEHFTFTADDFDTELIAVNAINILVIDDTEIYLDNIRFDGISPSMWPSLGMRF